MRAALLRLRERQENGEKGFSILELVIWIVVAGILMGAAIVGYNQYRTSAEVNNLKSAVRDAGTLVAAYEAENGSLTGLTDIAALDAWVDGGIDTDPATTGVQVGDVTLTLASDGDVTGVHTNGKQVTFDFETGQLGTVTNATP